MANEIDVQTLGKRKASVARVIFRSRASKSPQAGVIKVNGKVFEDYFPRETSRRLILQPLELTQSVGQYDIFINVNGGGLSGQAGAVRLGIARALIKITPDLRGTVKKAGMLTRDSRVVERKKYGMSGARKRYQYSKR